MDHATGLFLTIFTPRFPHLLLALTKSHEWAYSRSKVVEKLCRNIYMRAADLYACVRKRSVLPPRAKSISMSRFEHEGQEGWRLWRLGDRERENRKKRGKVRDKERVREGENKKKQGNSLCYFYFYSILFHRVLFMSDTWELKMHMSWVIFPGSIIRFLLNSYSGQIEKLFTEKYGIFERKVCGNLYILFFLVIYFPCVSISISFFPVPPKDYIFS